MTHRNTRPRAFAPDPAAPGGPCNAPGCAAAAAFRAPKSRSTLNEYNWFCLDHVREYNARWDYYKGMSAAEIERATRDDVGWQRPTWPLGQGGAKVFDASDLDHLLGAKAPRAAPADAAPPDLRQPLAALGLAWPTTLETVKTRYKTLAKQHHPDANGGDRAAEERLKTINLAYAALRAHLLPEANLA